MVDGIDEFRRDGCEALAEISDVAWVWLGLEKLIDDRQKVVERGDAGERCRAVGALGSSGGGEQECGMDDLAGDTSIEESGCEAAVGAWLARAADAHLEHRARAGLPLPLAWAKGRFTALLDGEQREIRGWVAPPFAFFHGSAAGLIPHGSTHRYTLVYTPTGRLLATFHYAAHCKALASDLARVWVRWDGAGAEPSSDPAPIVAHAK